MVPVGSSERSKLMVTPGGPNEPSAVRLFESVNVPAAALPLFTGDSTRIPVGSGPYNWNGSEPAPGMIAVQQQNPLPMNILAIMPDVDVAEPNA